MNEKLKKISEIKFKDIQVPIYYHHDNTGFNCAWQMRNPNTCYQGIVYMNTENGGIEYPEGVVIPKQTKKDREMLPKFVIIDKIELDPILEKTIIKYLNSQYKLRNKKTNETI